VHRHAFPACGGRTVVESGESVRADSSRSVDPMKGFYHGDALGFEV
jgi:hypothetical protein